MSYDAATEVRGAVADMLQYNRAVVMVALNNDGGDFGVLVGTIHDPEDIDVPKELDGIPIRVVHMDKPSPFEPRD